MTFKDFETKKIYLELKRHYIKMLETYVEGYAKLEFKTQFKFELQKLEKETGFSFIEIYEKEKMRNE